MSTDTSRYGGAWNRRDEPVPDPHRQADKWPTVAYVEYDGTEGVAFSDQQGAGVIIAETADTADLQEWR